MSTPAIVLNESGEHSGDWRVIVDSIGDADASLLSALRKLSPLPETHLATLLYQAPSVLAAGLEREAAEAVSRVLNEAGLESRVADVEEAFTPGKAAYELAVMVPEIHCMPELAKLLMRVLGVSAPKAREMLCASPTVLLGQLSLASAQALERRFEALGAEALISRTAEAKFDVFLGTCSPAERQRVLQALRNLRVELVERLSSGVEADAIPLVAAGLSKHDADRVWAVLQRTSLPVRLINRDFESFDIRLEAAPANAEMAAFLAESSGMPQSLTEKVLRRLPMVTHPSVSFEQMGPLLEEIHRLGGRATAHLLAFQTFDLEIVRLGGLGASSLALRAIVGLEEGEAHHALREAHGVEGPLTPQQARWLRWELAQAGTEAKLVLR